MPSPGISNGNAIREADKFQPTIVILSGAQRSRRISWEKAEILRLTSFAQNDKLYTSERRGQDLALHWDFGKHLPL